MKWWTGGREQKVFVPSDNFLNLVSIKKQLQEKQTIN